MLTSEAADDFDDDIFSSLYFRSLKRESLIGIRNVNALFLDCEMSFLFIVSYAFVLRYHTEFVNFIFRQSIAQSKAELSY